MLELLTLKDNILEVLFEEFKIFMIVNIFELKKLKSSYF